jgi:hypothetical protein
MPAFPVIQLYEVTRMYVLGISRDLCPHQWRAGRGSIQRMISSDLNVAIRSPSGCVIQDRHSRPVHGGSCIYV